MFCHFVKRSAPGLVDFDRARALMDKSLLIEIAAAVPRVAAPSEADQDAWLQTVWERYCAAHLARHGAPFRPDTDPNWA